MSCIYQQRVIIVGPENQSKHPILDSYFSDPFLYQLWLSTDDTLDPQSDHRLGFKINTTPLSRATRSKSFPVTGSVVIPSNINPLYCGPVFLIAEVDSTNVVTEANETNNARVKKITIVCAEGRISLF